MSEQYIPKMKEKYWTVASWTTHGLRPELATWNNDFIDKQRLSEGRVFDTQKEAMEFLELNPDWGI